MPELFNEVGVAVDIECGVPAISAGCQAKRASCPGNFSKIGRLPPFQRFSDRSNFGVNFRCLENQTTAGQQIIAQVGRVQVDGRCDIIRNIFFKSGIRTFEPIPFAELGKSIILAM